MVLVIKNPPANAADIRDRDSVPGSGRSSEEGNGYPLLYFCLGNPMDRGAWWAKSPWGHKRLGHDLVIEHEHE